MGYKKSEISTAAIVDATIAMIAKRGYADTSLAHIAATAGMSKGSIHYHYESKDALVETVLEEVCQRLHKMAYDSFPEINSPDDALTSGLKAMWTLRTTDVPESRVLLELLLQSFHDENLRIRLEKYYRLLSDNLLEFAKEQAHRFGVPSENATQQFARTVMAMADGFMLQNQVSKKDVTFEDFRSAVETFVIGYVSKQHPGLGSKVAGA